jgi:hypothetical protein
MRVELISPKAGMSGTIRECSPYESPLPIGTPVDVIDSPLGSPSIRIRDASGAEYQIGHWQVDCGKRYEVAEGDWRSESDPLVLDELERILTGCLRPPRDRRESIRAQVIKSTSEVLRRNGRYISTTLSQTRNIPRS